MRERALGIVNRGFSFLSTATIRQSGVTFTGTIVNGALGAAFYILAARALGPSAFGLVSVAISIATLASSVGDLGTDTGLVRFVSYYFQRDKTRANRFLKLTFKIKLIAGLLIAVVGIFLSGFMSQELFQKPELAPGLMVAFVSVVFMLLFGFVTSYLKAIQKFFLWSIVQIGANLVRILVIVALFLFGLLTVPSTVGVYAFTLLVGFIAGILFFVPKDFFFVKRENKVAPELFAYNKWIASFALVAAISSRLDIFISARLLTSTELGLYSAANQLVYIIPQIVGALGTVIAPKLAGMNEKRMIVYLKKTQLLVLGLAFLGLLAAPVVAFFVPLIFGVEYLGAIPPFYVLLVAMLVFLISVPVHNIILYHYSYPKLFFWLSVGHLIVIASFGWLLILRFGMMGAALTVLIGMIFNFVVPLVWVYRKINNKQ